MNRRRLLQLGGLAASGSLVFGTGAFTSIQAERTVEIAVTDDDDAYLALDADDDSGLIRTNVSDDTLEFSIPGAGNDRTDEQPTGRGVGANSAYTFADLLTVRNQGDDPVEVFSTAENLPDEFERIALVGGPGADLLAGEANAMNLDVGEEKSAGIHIETAADADTSGESIETAITIHADPQDESSPEEPGEPPFGE